MEGETAAKPIDLITKRHPDIESASSAKVAPLNLLVKTGEGRAPHPEETLLKRDTKPS